MHKKAEIWLQEEIDSCKIESERENLAVEFGRMRWNEYKRGEMVLQRV